MRTHYNTDLGKDDIGKEVRLCGWCNSYRDHGGIIFIDLRDRSGIIQLVADPSSKAHKTASDVRDEYILIAKGTVRARGEGLNNPKLKTGTIEVILDCVCSAIAEGVEERKVEKVDNKDAAEGEEVKPKRARISRRNKPAEETEEIATDDAEISDSAENNATEENAAAE